MPLAAPTGPAGLACRPLSLATAATGSTALDRALSIPASHALQVQEEVHCSACGRASHHSGYTQYFCMAQVRDLCSVVLFTSLCCAALP